MSLSIPITVEQSGREFFGTGDWQPALTPDAPWMAPGTSVPVMFDDEDEEYDDDDFAWSDDEDEEFDEFDEFEEDEDEDALDDDDEEEDEEL